MAKTSPFHSVKQDVHHNNTSCTEGNNVERQYLRQGTGGKPLCSHCNRLNNKSDSSRFGTGLLGLANRGD